MPERDFLDRMIAERTARNPEFPKRFRAAVRRRELFHALAERRDERNLTQTQVAAAMETSQSFIARLESTAGDARLSTIDRYAESLGYVVQYHLVPAEAAEHEPGVVIH